MTPGTLYYKLLSLTVYRSLLETPVMAACLSLLSALDRREGEDALKAWADLVFHLEEAGYSHLGKWMEDALLRSEAPFAHRVARGEEVSSASTDAAWRDVEILTELTKVRSSALRAELSALLPLSGREAAEGLPLWSQEPLGLSFPSILNWYRKMGAGIFARYLAFSWEGGELLPISNPDVPRSEELFGYRLQRSQVEANTRALLAGHRVNNVLLYGDSGTGKSATVKSLLTLSDTMDLRLIEISKDSMAQLPRLIRSLAGRRQKFILFIDDLAFDEDDRAYSALKTILEGGLEARPANVAVYATSNRRHLVRQTFSSRAGDEVDRAETIQEKTALADRFGLRIPYLGLSKGEFLELVEHLAAQAGLHLPTEALHARAIRWDARHPGRSPRTAQQFIASLSCE